VTGPHTNDFFCGEFSPFCLKNNFEKVNILSKNSCYARNSPKIGTTPYNMKGCLRIFVPFTFHYRQIWLNILMDDCHLSNNTKLEKYLKNTGPKELFL
jgi:hypothetical protein